MPKKSSGSLSSKKSQAPTKAVIKAPTPPAAASSLEEKLADAIAEKAATEAALASGEKRLKSLEAKQLARIKKNIAATEKRLIAKSGIEWEAWRPEGRVDYVVAPLPEPDGPLPFPVELRCFARSLRSRWDWPKPNANGHVPVEPTRGPGRSADQRRSDTSLALEALIAQWATLRPIVSPELAALVDASLKATKGLLGRRQVPDDERLRSTVDDLVDVANQLAFELEHQAARSEPVVDGAAVPDVEEPLGPAKASEPAEAPDTSVALEVADNAGNDGTALMPVVVIGLKDGTITFDGKTYAGVNIAACEALQKVIDGRGNPVGLTSGGVKANRIIKNLPEEIRVRLRSIPGNKGYVFDIFPAS